MTPSILFVCTGNICRSPLAEVAMRIEASKRGVTCDIDSAATGRWNLNEAPDCRAQNIIQKYHPEYLPYMQKLCSRQVSKQDFSRFTHIVALDQTHLNWLNKHKPLESKAKIISLLSYLPDIDEQEVPDPYFGSEKDFEYAWVLIEKACSKLATSVFRNKPLSSLQ
ncbi:low molecular weight phosphotyrosine protein phosphatase [Acetobacteraceae bacterium]|nr:low molecular weight phosphotyrosine protein phosphatase [Acetobacteraceae bacterium]